MLVLFNSETKATLPHPIAASDLFSVLFWKEKSVFCSAFDSSQKDICLKYFHFHCQKATGVGVKRATSAPKYLTVYALDEIKIFVLSWNHCKGTFVAAIVKGHQFKMCRTTETYSETGCGNGTSLFTP